VLLFVFDELPELTTPDFEVDDPPFAVALPPVALEVDPEFALAVELLLDVLVAMALVGLVGSVGFWH
jgi:hypothetical protein